MIDHKLKIKMVYLYSFIFLIVLLYGIGQIRSACNYKEAELEYYKKEIILEEKAFRLVFSNGYITIYHGEVQLTENSGLACFFTSGGVAYTTFKAAWKIEKLSFNELLAVAAWPGLPIKQIWHFLLKDDKLSWQVDLENSEDVTINHIGVVFFFRNNYQQWFTPYEQGRMPVLDALQLRKNVSLQVSSNFVGLSPSDKDAKSFLPLGLNLREDVILNEFLLSTCRDMFSKSIFSSISLGSIEPLRVLGNSKISLSSGKISLFNKKDDLLKYLIMGQNKIKN